MENESVGARRDVKDVSIGESVVAGWISVKGPPKAVANADEEVGVGVVVVGESEAGKRDILDLAYEVG